MKTDYLLPIVMLFLAFTEFHASADSYISEVYVNGTVVAKRPKSDSTLRLDANANDVWIRMGSAEPVDSFYCQLEGFDSRAIPFALSEPFARYTNLKGLDYTFKTWTKKGGVTSAANVWRIEKGRSLSEEGWFIPAIVVYLSLLAGAIVYFWTMYNVRQRRKEDKIRLDLMQDLHDELGSTLGSVALSGRLLRKKFPSDEAEPAAIVNRIISSTDDIISRLRDTYWRINPGHDDLDSVFEKMRAYGIATLPAAGIAFEFLNAFENRRDELQKMKISLPQRLNLHLIGREVLHNCAKHSGASRVTVAIEDFSDFILITIVDNGKGFDPNMPFTGEGLRGLLRRAKESHIKIEFSSEPGGGTTVRIWIRKIILGLRK